MNATPRFTAILALAAACGAAFAQTPTAPAASAPNAVGTSTETAKAANEKAIKRSDVATVVRTGPTAADRAKQAANKAESKVDGLSNADGTTLASDTTRNSTRDATRAPRADRN
ncbi:hypothetical protein [Roseateles sp.]|uniref:hypothetical protein n=1 Tax=Roseateles sp. TaxID=1971397 RepID=UPI003264F598